VKRGSRCLFRAVRLKLIAPSPLISHHSLIAPESPYECARTESSWDCPRTGELARIVRVNEEIKAIVATAFRINLMALNAIFLAKRAGNAALGFGVLSNELRRFAQDLTRHMASLRDMTSGSVGSVTGVVQQQRNSAILRRRSASAATACPACGRPQARRPRLAEQHGRLRALDLRLRAAVEETQQLVELGGVLARSAKIEAAYGGSFSPALMQVSTDFAEVIAQIKRSLEVLGKERLVKD
jgi:hypothetical protein